MGTKRRTWLVGFVLLVALLIMAARPIQEVRVSNFEELLNHLVGGVFQVDGSVSIDGGVDVNLPADLEVKALQEGSWSVGINGDVDVSLVDSTVQAEQSGDWSVAIESSDEDPVVVRVANGDAANRERFQLPLDFIFSGPFHVQFASIPPGKIFVMEHISARVETPKTDGVESIAIVSSFGTCGLTPHYLTLNHVVETPTANLHFGNHPVLTFHDQSCGQFRVNVNRIDDSAGSVGVRLTITGYLVDN